MKIEIGGLFIIFLVFLILKLCSVIAWSWWIIFMPLWLPVFIAIIFIVIVLIIYWCASDGSNLRN